MKVISATIVAKLCWQMMFKFATFFFNFAIGASLGRAPRVPSGHK